MLLQLSPVLVEPLDLFLDIVGQEVAVSFLVAGLQLSELALEELLVDYLGKAYAAPGRLGAVTWANAPLGSAYSILPELDFLEVVDSGVQVEFDVASIADQDPGAGVLDALGLDVGQLLEEGRHVEHDAGANEVDTARCNEAGWQGLEVVRHAVSLDGGRRCGRQRRAHISGPESKGCRSAFPCPRRPTAIRG